MSKRQYALWTNDVETHSIWHNSLRDETGEKVLKEGMPLLLELYAKHNIRTTFFFTGYIASKFPDVVKMVLPYGHEVGSHGLTHEVSKAFDILPFKEQVEHLATSKKILEDISGDKVFSFRAPALRVNADTPRALLETGFRIDSSVSSQRFDMFLSFGGLKKLKWLTAPRLPYRTRDDNLFKKGASPLIEIPISAFCLPYIGTTLRIFPNTTRLIRALLFFESLITHKPVVFDIHPNELIEEGSDKRLIQRRTNNPILFFISDWLRSQLKAKNLGLKAVPIFDTELSFLKEKKFLAVPIKEYCEEVGLLS